MTLARHLPTVLWSWTADTPLPQHERQRIADWLHRHGINPAYIVRAHVEVSDRAAVLVAEAAIPLPDGTDGHEFRSFDLVTPPPVPWTAPEPEVLRRAG